MSDYCVVIIDGARARFFTLVPAKQPEVESGPVLVEESHALVNPDVNVPGKKMWSDTKTGRTAGGGGGPVHGYDDHRDQHEDEFKRRFAKLVAAEAVSMAERKGARHLVVAAEKQMLGFLRNTMQVSPKAGYQVHEVAKDLSRLAPHDLHEHLAAEGVLPARNNRRG